jgi:hypothetical protein
VFVNERLFQVMVLTCNDSVNPKEPVDSTVTLNNEQKGTFTRVPAEHAAKGVGRPLRDSGCRVRWPVRQSNLGVTVGLPDVAPLFPTR